MLAGLTSTFILAACSRSASPEPADPDEVERAVSQARANAEKAKEDQAREKADKAKDDGAQTTNVR